MLVKNTKSTFAVFEAKEIVIAQQLQVKGGTDGDKPLPIIGDNDIVLI